MNKFEIKRGMVFYLEEPSRNQPNIRNTTYTMPKKKRPYVVLSNDGCNANSSCIHVAPLYSREDSTKPYLVSFTGNDGHQSVIDIGAIMLIPKSLCVISDYSERITQSVTKREVLDKISAAIANQFSISYDMLSKEAREVAYASKERAASVAEPQSTEQETPVQETPSVTAQTTQIPQIHLTINLNGVPVNIPNITASESNIVIDANTEQNAAVEEPVIEMTPDIVEETVKPDTAAINRCNAQGRLKKEDFAAAAYTIITMHQNFEGKMSTTALSRTTGMTPKTIKTIINKLNAMGRASLPKELVSDFIHDYMTLTREEMVRKYCIYGYINYHKIADSYRYYTKRKVACAK